MEIKVQSWIWILAITLTYNSLIRCEQRQDDDLPCAARDLGIPGRSVVCVCNSTYCDTITRVPPERGTFVSYTTTDSGKRFEKDYGVIQTDATREANKDDDDESPVVDARFFEVNTTRTAVYRIFTNTRHQFIEGFGGSVTDAAAINWRSLSDDAQTHMIESYFGSKGIEYNLIRTHIAGADFSTHPYTFNEYPWNDAALSNFSLVEEDLFYKMPMIGRSLRLSPHEVKIMASTWSPPIWMKTNERITGFGQLRPQYYQAYADYHVRYMEEYEKGGIKIWAITTTNEPINGIVPVAPFNSLGWLPSQLGRWVADNLGPTIRNSRFNATKIFAVDDQRYLLHFYMLGMEREAPECMDYIDGIAIHYYGNFFPEETLTLLQRRYPDKMLLSTEACEGPMPWHINRVEHGSWVRAHRYTQAILEDLNNFVAGWIDWNLCLDPNGGPNWANNFVDAPILVYKDDDEFIKQPMFYAMGHFSKFIPRGSRRIQVSRRSLATVENLAVLTPDNNIVIVLQNQRRSARNVRIRISRTRFIEVHLEPRSIKTIEINQN